MHLFSVDYVASISLHASVCVTKRRKRDVKELQLKIRKKDY